MYFIDRLNVLLLQQFSEHIIRKESIANARKLGLYICNNPNDTDFVNREIIKILM